MSIVTPDWVKNAVFYQIFPDRFARSGRVSCPGMTLKPWGAPPEEQGFQGGDLYGVVEKLDFLRNLGITALYLNPVFQSAANHRYHTFDYMAVDPLLGGDVALRELLDKAHARDMKVVLDGVFNHASRGFWPFHHVLENGPDSPYLDWFTIRDWPLRPYSSDETQHHNYESWWDLPALPKLNVANPGMRDYLLRVAEHWIDFGIDGWRLDVPEDIKVPDFWPTFRDRVKRARPDAYLLGEIWHEAVDWLRGDRFDAVMNYVFQRASLGFFAGERLRAEYRPGGFALKALDAVGFADAIDRMIATHDWQVTQAQLNLIDSHDTARTLWMAGDDATAVKLCVLFQMTMPGAPCIYYGDEIGMTGATDPYCRAAFPWHEPDTWDTDCLDMHRRAIAMRHQHPVLRTGVFARLLARGDVYGFRRMLGDDDAVIVLNAGSEPVVIDVPLGEVASGRAFSEVWGEGGAYQVTGGALPGVRVAARDAAVLIGQ